MLVAPSAEATFPGMNGQIAISGCGAADCGIFLINPDGSSATQITHNPYRYRSCAQDFGCFELPATDVAPNWSADGRKLAFARWVSDDSVNLTRMEIDTVNADGTGFTQLMRAPDAGNSPAWSPDGARIAFIQGVRSGDLYVMRADGTQATRIAVGLLSSPNWSPDGSTIAFARQLPDSRQTDIHLVNPDGTNDRVLLSSGPGSIFENSGPRWAPDGRRIALTRAEVPYPCCLSDSDVWVMSADGSGLQNLTGTPDQSDAALDWSPDGTKILFNTNGDWLRVMNSDGTGKATVASARGGGAWQPIDRSPDCSGVTASRTVLTSANRLLVAITLEGAADPDGDAVTLTVDGVTQDEPVTGRADATAPDAVVEGDGELRVRAERNPHGDGRVYRIAFTASDGRGGSCSGTATVSVPRKKHKPAVDSAPPSYDSLAT
jgi:dipeptidyl aminopeptidase/acylaminoacyl peptidase